MTEGAFDQAEQRAGRWRWLMLAMLVCLHFAATRGVEDFWARGLMMAHLGLFLVWQPFIQAGQRLKVSEVFLIVLITIGILAFLNWWMLGLWVAVLAGIVGGKVFLFQARWLRAFYLTVFSYLVALLLLWIVPSGFPNTRPDELMHLLVVYGLPLLFLVMAAIPVESDTAEPQVVDFFYASMIFLLLWALVLGSFTFMTVGGKSYVLSLMFSLFVIAGVLLFLSLAWNPRAGFSGLQMVFSRYLLSIGLPFEQWLHFLAELSRSESRPDQFLKEACAGLGRLPWVTGGSWMTAGESGEFGAPSKYTVDYAGREVSVRLYCRHRPSPSLVWHFNLLGQLVGQFYVAKQRELKLQQQTYVQALHETGARMTHDVKNLLQTLNVLCSAAERDPEGDPGALQALMRRHLPTVLQRLQQTLDKLQRPQMDSGRFITAEAWWESLQKTYQLRGVVFEAAARRRRHPAAEGSLRQRRRQPAAERAREAQASTRRQGERLPGCGDEIVLRVCDSGRAGGAERAAGPAARSGAVGDRLRHRAVPGGAAGRDVGVQLPARGQRAGRGVLRVARRGASRRPRAARRSARSGTREHRDLTARRRAPRQAAASWTAAVLRPLSVYTVVSPLPLR